VHKAEQIEVYALDPHFLDAIAKHIGDRGCSLEVTVSEGELYVTAGGEALQSTLTKVPLA
jgi:uncharacterized protein YaeQ